MHLRSLRSRGDAPPGQRARDGRSPRTVLGGFAAAALAALLAPDALPAQLTPAAEARLRRILDQRAEAQVLLAASPADDRSLLMLRPRVDRGLLVGEVRTGSLGPASVFESRAYPLDQVREVRVKENYFWQGTVYGAVGGVIVSRILHQRCGRVEECTGPWTGFPTFYAMTALTAAGAGGGIGFYLSRWKIVYSHTPGALRIAGGGARDPGAPFLPQPARR